MKTRFPITCSKFGYTVPAGVRCDRAYNLPKDANENWQYWARGWRGMSKSDREAVRGVGILLSVEEIKNGN